MNKKRRQALEEIVSQVGELRERLQEVLDEEQEAYGNMPESIQDSGRGCDMYDGISSLEDSVSGLDDVVDGLNEVIEK